MKKFFVNPGGRKRRRKATTARRRRRTNPRGRGGRFISRKRKVATVARKRRTRKRSSARRTTARRRIRRNAPTRYRRRGRIVRVRRRSGGRTRTVKRRSYRRNPGIVNTIMRGLVDAGLVTGGKVVTNLGARAIPASLTAMLPGMAGDVVKGLGVATIVAIAAGKVLGGDKARMVSAGAYQAVLESVLRTVNVPMVSTALGEYDIMANNYNGLGSYPRPVAALPAGVGSYPTPQFEGEQYAYEQG